MTGRIGHWRRLYRVRGTPAGAARLDRLAAGPVLDAYAAALDRVQGDGDEVVLVRQVLARIVAPAGDDADLARRWGEGMAAAVLRAVTTRAGDDDAVVRFPDRAAHRAAFAAAVAAGRPADDWYYARFAPLHRPTPAETVRAALLADVATVPAVLRRLAEAGHLPRVLRVLGPDAAAQVWAAVAGLVAAPPDADRPLFAAALGLLDRLGMQPVPAARAEEWFAGFAAGRPPADWRDRGALADAVAAAVRFVVPRVVVTVPSPADLDRAVAPLDWVDTGRLRAELDEAVARPSVRPAVRSRPVRPGPTARQNGWLAAVRAVLPRVLPHLDRADLRSPANAALVYAAVLVDHPTWADDPALPGFVDQLLAAAARAAEPGEADPAGGPPAFPASEQLGGVGTAVVRELAGPRRPPARGPEPAAPVGIETAAAGVFLLLRAARDLRLGAVAARAGFPAAGPRWLLAAVAAKWAGLSPDADPAPALFAGLDDPAGFRATWAGTDPEAAGRFQAGLARMLLGHRLLNDAEPLHVGSVDDLPPGRMLIGGNEAGTIWPYAAPVGPGDEAGVVARWAVGWPAAVGPSPATPAAVAAVDLFGRVPVGDPLADATLTAAAQAGVRAWARWLKQFHAAGSGYLLGQFVRRPGRVYRDGPGLLVELDPRPVDVVLQLSGYFDPIDPVPGSGDPAVRFRLGRAG